MADASTTASALDGQWRNPVGFMSLLTIIGGPVIQSALAQLTGPSFVPICFSFGWVSYAFSTIASLLGDGRLMPSADYPCKVINLKNGYTRSNRSWIVGRLLRDLEQPLSSEALRVEVYEADEPPDNGGLTGGKSTLFGCISILIQMGIAAIPFACFRDWGPFLITASGTCAALATAGLPQWRVEKLACRVRSKKKIAITAGNGSRHVVVILGEGNCLDIEDLAAGEGPRNARPWIKSRWCIQYVDRDGNTQRIPRATAFRDYMQRKGIKSRSPNLLAGTWIGIRYFPWYRDGEVMEQPTSKHIMEDYMAEHGLREKVASFRGLPLPFWLTRLCCGLLILAWTALLISVQALTKNAWYLVAIGTVGMAQNVIAAAASRDPKTRGIYLKQDPMIFIGDKVMDVLMDLESCESGCGRSLLKEFFPASLYDDEQEWWDTPRENRASARNRYNQDRYQESNRGKRYDSQEVDRHGVPSRGSRWGGQTGVGDT
jgi:hypothetical protein